MIDTFNQHRPLLFGVAYRMLGQVAEAEDMVQETWLRWQKQNPDAVDSPRAWLVATLTRLCIDQLRSARRQREDYYGVWLPEPLVDTSVRSPEESAALADSVTMAFLLMLEALNPVERAVFLLREVFDYDYTEIARIVGKSAANCRQIARRAKARIAPAERDGAKPPTPDARGVAERFLAAMASGDLSDLLALLTSDAKLYTDGGGVVASAGRPIVSADRVGRFFVGVRRKGAAWRHRLAVVNGRLGALVFSGEKLDRVVSFDLAGDRVRAIYIVRNPMKLRRVIADDAAREPVPAAVAI